VIRAAALLTLALAQTAGAFELPPFKLSWPVDCTLGDTCHIQQYFDHDAGLGASDFTCGPLSYDGHDGTDIALATRIAMAAGVAVLAAAPGTVRGVRDGVEDFLPPQDGRECGNGVLIDHGAGWVTQYCHLRQGSVRVSPGDVVAPGTPLGLIGQSGMADFPHLHLSVRQNGVERDPFAPNSTTCGTEPGAALWAAPLPYEPGGFLVAGRGAGAMPARMASKSGTASEKPAARKPPGS
jgi:murein DD-endopeptidase MepM/ murein hydrolase activator NlpD